MTETLLEKAKNIKNKISVTESAERIEMAIAFANREISHKQAAAVLGHNAPTILGQTLIAAARRGEVGVFKKGRGE